MRPRSIGYADAVDVMDGGSMGMTLAEKIMAAHGGGGRAEPGLEVELSADRILLGERTVHRLLEEVRRSGREGAGGEGASRVVALLDQFLGPLDGDRKTSFRELRTFARRLGFLHLYGMGRGGIEAVLYADGGMGVPGALLVADDPVSGLLGALGALVVVPTKAGLMGAVRTGGVSVQVPETFRVILRGKPGPWVGGKDLAIELYSLLGPRGASGRCLEITGEAVDHLPVHQRLALAAFAVNTGARHVLFEPDEKTITFARARSDTPFRPVHGDPDAFVADVVELDVGSMEPRVALGPRPEEVRPVPKARDLRLDQVVIGGNGNGRIEDLRAAAALLREYRVNPNVRLVLVPGSQQVLLHAMEEGLVQVFLKNGAHLAPPSSYYFDLCHRSGLGPGERCLTTAARIYPEEEGVEILYANPEVAAASAVMGHVADPFEMFRAVKRKSTGLMW